MAIEGYGVNNQTWDQTRKTMNYIPQDIINIGNALEDIFNDKVPLPFGLVNEKLRVDITCIEKRATPVYGYAATYVLSFNSNFSRPSSYLHTSLVDACNSLETNKIKIIFSTENDKIIVNVKE